MYSYVYIYDLGQYTRLRQILPELELAHYSLFAQKLKLISRHLDYHNHEHSSLGECDACIECS